MAQCPPPTTKGESSVIDVLFGALAALIVAGFLLLIWLTS